MKIEITETPSDVQPSPLEDRRGGGHGSTKLGDIVQALVPIVDPETLHMHARVGGLGHVIELRAGYFPTPLWERSGTVCDASPEEFKVLCGLDFATRPKTTPGY